MQFETDAQGLILAAGRKARALGHSYVGSVHLLLALAKEPGLAGQLLRGAGFESDLAESMALVLYGVGTPDLPLPQGFSGQARRVLKGAREEARQLGSRQVRCVHILLALLRREKTAAGDLLILNGVDAGVLFTRTVEYLQWNGTLDQKREREAVSTKLLEQFSEDLLLKAVSMEPVIGREREIDTVIGILSRKNKNNPALVGEAGCW